MSDFRRIGAIALLLLPLTSCAAMDFDSPSNTSGGAARMAPPLIVDGYGNPAPELQQPLQMMQDPEQEQSEWDDPIIAADPEEAERECRARAERDGVELIRVQQPSQVRRGQNQSYRCWFK